MENNIIWIRLKLSMWVKLPDILKSLVHIDITGSSYNNMCHFYIKIWHTVTNYCPELLQQAPTWPDEAKGHHTAGITLQIWRQKSFLLQIGGHLMMARVSLSRPMVTSNMASLLPPSVDLMAAETVELTAQLWDDRMCSGTPAWTHHHLNVVQPGLRCHSHQHTNIDEPWWFHAALASPCKLKLRY